MPQFLPGLGSGYALAALLFQALRTILWACYRPYPRAPGPLPSVTVIVPAFNAGAMVEQAIYSAAAADYPGAKLKIICIDDSSTDSAWTGIAAAGRR
jgi:hyaluronan synthase